MDNSSVYESEIKVRFQNARLAAMAIRTLEVDDELQPNRIEKTLHQEGNMLRM